MQKKWKVCENSLTVDPGLATTLTVHCVYCALIVLWPLPNDAHLGFTWRGKYFFRMWQIISAERGPHPHSAALRDCPMQVLVEFFNFYIDTVQCTQYLRKAPVNTYFLLPTSTFTLYKSLLLGIFTEWALNKMSPHQSWDAFPQSLPYVG